MSDPEITSDSQPPVCARRVASSESLGALVEFVEDKRADAKKDLTAREQMEASWRGGTDESWRAAGCKLSRTARLHESAVQGRIADRKRYEVEMFSKVIESLKAPNNRSEARDE